MEPPPNLPIQRISNEAGSRPEDLDIGEGGLQGHGSLVASYSGSLTVDDEYMTPSTPSIQQAPCSTSHDRSASPSLLMPHGVASTTTVRGVRHYTAQASPTAAKDVGHGSTFLPTPPPEPHSPLPQFECTTSNLNFHTNDVSHTNTVFRTSNVFPYGVRTPGVVYCPEDDYFGK